MKRIIYLLVAAIGLLVGCTPEEETWVQAGFTTDKESYEIGDLITLTNTSTVENARIAVCKWEFMGKVMYDLASALSSLQRRIRKLLSVRMEK